MKTRVLLPALLLGTAWVVGGLTARIAAQTSTPHLVKVFVTTARSGDATDLRDRQESVKDLRKALAGKKKTFTVVDDEEGAEMTVDVISRTSTIPKVRIGLASPGGPQRAAWLKVKVTRGENDPVEFTNKNTVFETTGGWQT